MNKRLLRIEEAAEFLNLKVSTLYQWSSMNKIKKVKLGRKLLFDIKDLEELIESNKISDKDFS